jgi:uncharacterized repeat protein (TIGR01451 family)
MSTNITVDDGKTSVVPGTSTTYTIVVSNSGPAAVTGAAISDPLPAGVTAANWTSSTTGGGTVIGPAAGTGSLTTTVDLPANATVTFSFTATIDPSATGSLVNIAEVTPPGDPTIVTADTDTLTPQADLSVTMTDIVTPVVPGNGDTYLITVMARSACGVSAISTRPMSALGHKQTQRQGAMSALPPKTDIDGRDGHVRFVPIARTRAAKSVLIRSPGRRVAGDVKAARRRAAWWSCG